MSDIYTVIKEIEKKKNLEMNLSKYANNLMSLYHRYSNIEFALRYYTYVDIISEDEEFNGSALNEYTEVLNRVVGRYLDGKLIGDDLEVAINQLDTIRNSVIATTKILTSYVDVFQIYEYALNRIEYRFSDEEVYNEHEEEEIIEEIFNYIRTDKDAVVLNAKMRDILGQLPIRITKQKYFEMVSDSLSLYKNATKSTLDGLLYMLRTCTMLEEIKDEDNSFKELNTIVKAFENIDFNFITKEEYESLSEKLVFGSEIITKNSDLFVMLAELINSSMVVLFSLPYAITDTSESKNYLRIIELVNKVKFNEINEDEVFKLFVNLEGNQERILGQIDKTSYLIDDRAIFEHDLLKSLMVDKIYNSLKTIKKLVSTSVFVELGEANDDTIIINEEELYQIRDHFIEELMVHLKKYPKLISRGIMASTLSVIPIVFSSLDEFESYVKNAFSMCSDPYEKIASINLISSIIESERKENGYW